MGAMGTSKANLCTDPRRPLLSGSVCQPFEIHLRTSKVFWSKGVLKPLQVGFSSVLPGTLSLSGINSSSIQIVTASKLIDKHNNYYIMWLYVNIDKKIIPPINRWIIPSHVQNISLGKSAPALCTPSVTPIVMQGDNLGWISISKTVFWKSLFQLRNFFPPFSISCRILA